MTKTFTYTFSRVRPVEGVHATGAKFIEDTITLRKKVTDSMEPVDYFKEDYAARYFTGILRKDYGFKKLVVTAARVWEESLGG